MIRTIYIKDENPDRYTLRAPTHILGKTYDNNAEKIKVIFPAVEIEKSSACTMLVFANGEQIDSISVSNNVPFDITNVLSRHKEIEIGFRFTNSDDYVKNCDFDTFYFKEVKQPEPFTPESPEQEEQINTLLGQAFVDVRWKTGSSNEVEFLNLSGGVQKTLIISGGGGGGGGSELPPYPQFNKDKKYALFLQSNLAETAYELVWKEIINGDSNRLLTSDNLVFTTSDNKTFIIKGE